MADKVVFKVTVFVSVLKGISMGRGGKIVVNCS